MVASATADSDVRMLPSRKSANAGAPDVAVPVSDPVARPSKVNEPRENWLPTWLY